jgi:hypothetical protein
VSITTLKSDPNGPPVPGWPDVKGTLEVTYVGAVLRTGEHNGYDDSDFYADVWDDATNAVKRVTYATTRGWTYANGAHADATPDVRAKAAAYYTALALADLKAKAAEDALTPAKGKAVKVVKGRKVPLGTEGVVIWVGEGRYYGPVPRYKNGWSTKPAARVGLKTADGTTFFTAASNVVVTDPEDWVADLAVLESTAAYRGASYAGLDLRAA